MTDPVAVAPPAVAAPVAAGQRLTTIDTFRGLTILEVVGHHATGMGLRHTDVGSTTHDLLLVLNRTLHFAVPAFVFLSALVLTHSLLRHFDLPRYFWRRLTRGAWPYLLWSALYAWWYVKTGQRAPETLTDPERWRDWLLYGKASYHLYFLLVALEVYLVLPLMLPLARRRPSITLALLVGTAVQLGLYLLNREVLHLPYPASTVLWYALPTLLGLAVGAGLDSFPAWWRRRRWVLLPLLAASYAAYLPVAMNYVRGQAVKPIVYSGLSWVFTALVALALLGLASRLQRGESAGMFRRTIGTLGTVSLPIYLLHPALLQALERHRAPQGEPQELLLTVALYALVALAVPALIGWRLRRKKLGLLLFGR
ncbi:acyltransferase [Deinococcus hopiensis]|uniref:Membrane-bound acyltransferase YfiQ, involved in biofilm formation n=1 Tax=Deinococcus hopiensis KR-140 TaxID=695939 RepID=A0A1W1VJ99_9DEIO|nr:acyltransferase [Deinococcus hopiensis]SMB93406.1 Membrane-bound acyltransferase YfiQ, involved in biofilm formation [Deinococcus hopiensis KR-140]